MLTQDELRKKRWRKELRRKRIRKEKRKQRGFELKRNYWKNKKLTKKHREHIRDGKVNVSYSTAHKNAISDGLKKFWRKVKKLMGGGQK